MQVQTSFMQRLCKSGRTHQCVQTHRNWLMYHYKSFNGLWGTKLNATAKHKLCPWTDGFCQLINWTCFAIESINQSLSRLGALQVCLLTYKHFSHRRISTECWISCENESKSLMYTLWKLFENSKRYPKSDKRVKMLTLKWHQKQEHFIHPFISFKCIRFVKKQFFCHEQQGRGGGEFKTIDAPFWGPRASWLNHTGTCTSRSCIL